MRLSSSTATTILGPLLSKEIPLRESGWILPERVPGLQTLTGDETIGITTVILGAIEHTRSPGGSPGKILAAYAALLTTWIGLTVEPKAYQIPTRYWFHIAPGLSPCSIDSSGADVGANVWGKSNWDERDDSPDQRGSGKESLHLSFKFTKAKVIDISTSD